MTMCRPSPVKCSAATRPIVSTSSEGASSDAYGAASTMTVVAASAGDHSAGEAFGDASGGHGKGHAPASGQTLHFFIGTASARFDLGAGFVKLATIVGVAAQKLLREVGIVVADKLLCDQRGSPIRNLAHTNARSSVGIQTEVKVFEKSVVSRSHKYRPTLC